MLTGKIFLDAGRQMLVFLELIYRNILWLLFSFKVIIKTLPLNIFDNHLLMDHDNKTGEDIFQGN